MAETTTTTVAPTTTTTVTEQVATVTPVNQLKPFRAKKPVLPYPSVGFVAQLYQAVEEMEAATTSTVSVE